MIENESDAEDTFAAMLQWQKKLGETPHDIKALRHFAFAAANHDRALVVQKIDEFLAHELPHADECDARLMQLAHIEHLEREKRGFSTYAADDVHESCFRFATDAVQKYRDAVAAWKHPSGARSAKRTMHEAYIALILGNYEEATSLTDILRPLVDPRMGTARFTGGFFDHIEEETATLIKPLPLVEWRGSHAARRCVFIGCDENYLVKHGQWVGSTLRGSGTDAVLHTHVFDGNIFEYPASLETTSARATENAKLYYAAARFIRMWQLMENTGLPTIMLDADLFVNQSLDSLFDRLEKHDVLLCRMPGRVQFHSQMNASVVCVNSTQNGLRFLRRVSGFILKHFATGLPTPWCLDQIALNCTAWNMKLENIPLNAAATGRHIYDGSWSDGVMLWPQKCASARQDRDKWIAARRRFGVNEA